MAQRRACVGRNVLQLEEVWVRATRELQLRFREEAEIIRRLARSLGRQDTAVYIRHAVYAAGNTPAETLVEGVLRLPQGVPGILVRHQHKCACHEHLRARARHTRGCG